jgi:hypothetical protein
VSLVVSFIPEDRPDVEIRHSTNVRFSGELLAGAAKRVITPPKELWDRMKLYGEEDGILGVADDVHARVIALATPGQKPRMCLVSLELLVISPNLRPAIQSELDKRKLADVHFLLCATHTHAGPGNYWNAPIPGGLRRKYLGEYNQAFVDHIVTQTVDAMQEAVTAMRPARIAFGAGRTRQFVRQRRYEEPVTGLEPPVDDMLGVLRIDDRATERPIAFALNIGAHPTTLLHHTERRVSGEYPGAISRRLEEEHPGCTALFVQGATGSVRSTGPRNEHYKGIEHPKFAKVAMQADMLRAAVARAEAGMTFEDTVDLSSVCAEVSLPEADLHFFPEERPWVGVRFLTIIPSRVVNWIADYAILPEETTFQALRVNHAYLCAFPCDLGDRVGEQLRRYIQRDHVWVAGLANDYSMGYVLSREEYDMGGVTSLGGTERVQDFYGKLAGPFCIKTAIHLARMIQEPDADDILHYRPGESDRNIPGIEQPAPPAEKTPMPDKTSKPDEPPPAPTP